MPEFRILFPDQFCNPDDFDRFGNFDPVRNAQADILDRGILTRILLWHRTAGRGCRGRCTHYLRSPHRRIGCQLLRLGLHIYEKGSHGCACYHDYPRVVETLRWVDTCYEFLTEAI